MESSSAAQYASILAQNPQLLNALQGQLGNLIGQSSGYVETLPKIVRRRLDALENIQDEHFKLEQKFRAEVLELEKKYHALQVPLYKKRADIVNGTVEPSDDDCSRGEKFSHAAKDGAESETGIAEITDVTEKMKDTSVVTGVPEFWATCLKNSPVVESIIAEDDDAALAFLTDIKVSYLEGNPGFRLDFTFAENPYFSNTVLSKSYYLTADEDEETAELMYDRAEGTKIEWKEGKDLSVRVETKKQRHKATNKTRVVKRTVPNETFFNFFKPPQIPSHDHEGDEECDDEIDENIGQKLQEDYEIGEHIKESIIPRAIAWFTGRAADQYQESEDEEDYDEDEYEGDDQDEDDDDDEEGGARAMSRSQATNLPPGQQAPECKQQ